MPDYNNTYKIKTIFEEHWYKLKGGLSGIYEESHWKAIEEAVEKMLGCGDISRGYINYRCINCGEDKKIGFS